MNAKEFKDKYAIKQGFSSWEDLFRQSADDIDYFHNKVMEQYAEAYLQKTINILEKIRKLIINR